MRFATHKRHTYVYFVLNYTDLVVQLVPQKAALVAAFLVFVPECDGRKFQLTTHKRHTP